MNNKGLLDNQKIYTAYENIFASIRSFAKKNNIREILPAPVAIEFEFPKRYSLYTGSGKNRVILPASNSFQKQVAADILGAVYCIAPTYRREVKMTKNIDPLHLNFFTEIEVEFKGKNMMEAKEFAAKMLQTIEKNFPAKLNKSNKRYFATFDTIDLTTMKKTLSKKEYDTWSNDLSFKSKKPIWILHTPQTRPPWLNADFPGRRLSLGFDLILPNGYGEILSGGERHRQETIKFFSKRPDISFDDIPSSGFGIGLERLVRFLLGASTVVDILPFHNRLSS